MEHPLAWRGILVLAGVGAIAIFLLLLFGMEWVGTALYRGHQRESRGVVDFDLAWRGFVTLASIGAGTVLVGVCALVLWLAHLGMPA